MSNRHSAASSQSNSDSDSNLNPVIPIVEYIEPRIKIYDAINDGSYFYRGIGFTSKIME